MTEAQICEKVKEELDGLRMFCEIGEGSIAVDETEDIDWINKLEAVFPSVLHRRSSGNSVLGGSQTGGSGQDDPAH